MASDLHCTHVEIDSCVVAFQTDCSDALATLGSLLGELFSNPYYEYRLFDAANATRVPTFRYLDRTTYGVEFDAAETTCVLLAPWSEIRELSLLGMFMYALSEVVRQQRGEYLLHGSAVVRDGHAIVLYGPGQSGKTIMALHLCLEHGFALFANNKIKATSTAGELRLVRGDPVFNFRLNALRRYSKSLAEQVFPDAGDGPRPWNVKKVIIPDRLRIQTAPPGALLATFAFLQVNGEEVEASIDTLGHSVLGDSEFTARATLYEELSGLISRVELPSHRDPARVQGLLHSVLRSPGIRASPCRVSRNAILRNACRTDPRTVGKSRDRRARASPCRDVLANR